jgi:hypothetical protein
MNINFLINKKILKFYINFNFYIKFRFYYLKYLDFYFFKNLFKNFNKK